MGIRDICDRIAADAEAEAEAIIAAAQKTAEKIAAESAARIARADAEDAEETAAKVKGIEESYSASSRLEANKIALAAKRRVLDEVYNRALKRLLTMDKKDFLALCGKLISSCAEEGDEIVFAPSFPYKKEVCELKEFKESKIKLSFAKGGEEGIMLRGKTSDKDLSFASLIEEDRAAHEAETAAELFG